MSCLAAALLAWGKVARQAAVLQSGSRTDRGQLPPRGSSAASGATVDGRTPIPAAL